MNKFDLYLILIIFIISSTLFVLTKKENGNIAKVYYDNNLVKTINLNKNKEYDVEGYNGNVHIKVENNILKVTDEISPKHLCQKKAIKNKNEKIICLPNKIVIKIEDDNIDTVIGD